MRIAVQGLCQPWKLEGSWHKGSWCGETSDGMKKDEQTEYPPFDPARFKDAITDACKFWQNKLALADWFIDAPLVSAEPKETGFKTKYLAGYRNAAVLYVSGRQGWTGVSDQWCAMSIGHELLHLICAPVVEVAKTNLDGRWYDEIHTSEESVVDRLATLIWGLFSEEERAQIISLFAAARKA